MSSSSLDFAVTFAAASPFLSDPASLTSSHLVLHRLRSTKRAGELSDALVFTVLTAANTGSQKDGVVQALKGIDGVLRVDEPMPRMRAKRDEF